MHLSHSRSLLESGASVTDFRNDVVHLLDVAESMRVLVTMSLDRRIARIRDQSADFVFREYRGETLRFACPHSIQ